LSADAGSIGNRGTKSRHRHRADCALLRKAAFRRNVFIHMQQLYRLSIRFAYTPFATLATQQVKIMKTLVKAAAFVAAIAMPLVSFAQTAQPVTRAQVKAELVQLENAGYRPSDFSDTHYPDNILAAEAKVAAQKALTPSSGAAYDHH
jgi:hypothetical protein